MDRIIIRKLIWNIFSESKYINTMMELEDRKNPDSAIALLQEELTEILIMLSQADYLHDYLKEHGVLSVKDEINDRSVKEIVQLLANNLISEETGYDMITNLLNANTDTKPNTGKENADKFREIFGIYATELWAMPENEFLKWLNSDFANDINVPNKNGRKVT